ncbi:MAG: hypothetical protein KF745_07790 [Phycisphaeraceae bacterium]|nr:hypothetical protein [Phycisphaeraceae bacterium]
MPFPRASVARTLLALAAAILAARPLAAAAQPTADRPPSARRVVHLFDFEEHLPDSTGFVNPDPVPLNWERVWSTPTSPPPLRGFPQWNAAAFDLTTAHSGEASVKLPANGGSTRLSLAPGVIPVLPGGDYLVSAYVRTNNLRSARAFVVTRFLDASRTPIPGSEARSLPIESQDEWTPVLLDLRGKFDSAVFLQIDLELLQAVKFQPPGPLAEQTVFLEDLDAAAWFDDVAVFLIPRTELVTTAPANLFLAPDRPLLRTMVRDMVGDDLQARISIIDADGHVVASNKTDVDPSGRPSDWTPDLPAFGWYRATLETYHEAALVGRASLDLIWFPPLPADSSTTAPERTRFGIAADVDAPEDQPWPRFLPHLTSATGAGFLILPAADPTQFPLERTDDAPGLTTVIDQLLDRQVDLTVSFHGVSRATARELDIDSSDTLAAIARAETVWLPLLAPMLERYGQRIRRWQIGPTGADAAAWRADPAAVGAFRAGVGRFVPGPVISLPWRAEFPPPAQGAAGVGADSVSDFIPYTFPASSIFPTLDSWYATAAAIVPPPPNLPIDLVLDVAPTTSFGNRAGAADLVRRTADAFVAAERAGMPRQPRLAIRDAWRVVPGDPPAVAPAPHLAAWRTIIDHFTGRRAVAELPITPGVRAVVLADRTPAPIGAPSRGTIVAWNHSADPKRAILHAYLGDSPVTVTDIFGNSRLLEPDRARAYLIAIPSTPIFIDGIDPNVARFVSSFRIEPGFAPASITEHDHRIVLENPWPIRISGKIQIVEPVDGRGGWTISPRGPVPISIAPGASQRIPLTFAFGAAQESGPQPFKAIVTLSADRTLPPLELETSIDIGLPELDLTADLILGPTPAGPDASVVATIVNRGASPRTLRLTALASGYATQEQPISNLAPGESAVKKFLFKDAAAKIPSKRIRLSLSDIDAPERLNISVQMP